MAELSGSQEDFWRTLQASEFILLHTQHYLHILGILPPGLCILVSQYAHEVFEEGGGTSPVN